jgi:hypothetical protein
MKKGIFILLGMFMMVSTVEAKKGEDLSNRFGVNYYTYNNAVNFFENGIEFFVFTNGDFDFDLNATNRNVRIDRDFEGRIRRIGNVSLRYDFRGNVTRIGNIRINYFSNRLRSVGDLRVRYDRWNAPIFYGNVNNFYYNNGVRFSVNFGDVFGYNDRFFSRNDFGRNYNKFREDRNFFYYRARPNANIGNRSTIIKRRKPATVRGNTNNISRGNSNTIYRKDNVKRNSSSNRGARNSNSTNIKRNETKRSSNLINRDSNSTRKSMNRTKSNTDNKRSTSTIRRSSEVKKRTSKTDSKRKG